MSSARKRAALGKANAEAERLRQKLAVAETMGNVWKAAAEYAAKTADDRQARIDALMLEYCPDEMTEAQKENWAKHQRPVSEEMQQGIDSALMGSNAEITGG
jgi:uncharacterized iron-regulated protein